MTDATEPAPAPAPTDPAAILRSRNFVLLLVFAAVIGVVVSLAEWAFLGVSGSSARFVSAQGREPGASDAGKARLGRRAVALRLAWEAGSGLRVNRDKQPRTGPEAGRICTPRLESESPS